jgi:hypothetical protein
MVQNVESGVYHCTVPSCAPTSQAWIGEWPLPSFRVLVSGDYFCLGQVQWDSKLGCLLDDVVAFVVPFVDKKVVASSPGMYCSREPM